MFRHSAKNMNSSIIEPDVNKSSFLLILLFWASAYITGLRDLIYGYKGWFILLFMWSISFSMSNTYLRRISLTIISKYHAEIAMLAVWTLVILLNVLFDRGDVVTAYHHFAATIVLWILYLTAIVYLHKSPVRFSMNVTVIIIALSVTCTIILPTLYSNPQIVRGAIYKAEMESFFIAGTTNFFSSYAIALPCLYIFALQQKGIRRVIFIMLCLLLIATILLSTMASAVLLVFMGIIGLALFIPKSRKIAVLLLFISSAIAVLLSYSEKVGQVGFFLNKASFIYHSIRTEGIFNVERGNDALLSLSAIKENPFFGIGPVTEGTFTAIGEHSSWLDNIAQYGFVGFAPFVCFLFLGFRRLWRIYSLDKKNMMIYARIVCFMLYLIHGLLNPWAFDSTAFALFITLAMAPEKL